MNEVKGKKIGMPDWFIDLHGDEICYHSWIDHPSYDEDENFYSEPYSLPSKSIRELIEFCDKNGLEFSIRGDSEHHDHCFLIRIGRKYEIPSSYPPIVEEEILKMNGEYGVGIAELVEKYKDIYNTDWMDDEFDSDDDRHSYCIRRLWIDLVEEYGSTWQWGSARVTCGGRK